MFHNAVRSALEKDGWTITDDPLFVKVTTRSEFFIDLAAEKLLTAQKEEQQIAVEVKSFIGRSIIKEFHLAVGQFLNYRLALEQVKSQKTLYLAVPVDTYEVFFPDDFVRQAVATYQIKLLIFNPVKEEIFLWKN
ncbi:MAG: fatty-acid oxidation protein subunit alpha [Symploca sp. SIO1B1]|nr:fatty-acid oxidation protein subunit alpha [Symploca sp. SIO1C2]NER97585.1 fatty-acid oxidation protein subunit alpha [Symploca sp. SIO1B1]